MSSILPSSEQVTQTNILVQIKYKCIAISGQDTSTRPYLKANFEFNLAEVYCFVIPWSVKFSFLATIFKDPLLTLEFT